jgi:hypothetical protein
LHALVLACLDPQLSEMHAVSFVIKISRKMRRADLDDPDAPPSVRPDLQSNINKGDDK